MSICLIKNSVFVFDDANNSDLEFIQFRLTDSALKGIEHLANGLGESSFRITFSQSGGSFILPTGGPSCKFTFNTSIFANSQDDSFSCLQVKKNSTICIGKLTSRITVNAKEDSFSTAKERMAQLEDENKKYHTKELSIGKGVSHKLSQPKSLKRCSSQSALIKSKPAINKPTESFHALSSLKNNRLVNNSGYDSSPLPPNPSVSTKSLRERIIHLLALKPYQYSELLLRLTRDGLSDAQKRQIYDILSSVGRSGRESAYHLIPSVHVELDPNWPGYSDSEKRRVVSLKNKFSNPSTKSPNDRSHTSSPANSSLRISDDQFARRPTRANAPSAPHALSKKIAALDMLNAGVNDMEVASRLGVYRGLLDQWRTNEAELRERHKRHYLSSQTESLSNISSIADSSKNLRMTPQDSQPLSRLDKLSSIETQISRRTNPPNFQTTSPLKCVRSGISAELSNAPNIQRTDSNQTSDPRTSQVRTSVIASRPNYPDSHPNPVDDQPETVSPIQEQLDTYSRHNHPCAYNIISGAGSEGESAEHTPFSNSSTGSSGYGGSIIGQIASIGSWNSRRSGPATHMNQERFLSHPEGSGLSVHSAYLASRLRSTMQSCADISNCEKDNLEALHGSVAASDIEDNHSSDLEYKLAEIERLYPKISTAKQASLYHAEFESTYPTYLRMYHSFSDIWKTVKNLRSRLLDATRTEGLDSALTSHLANQLDSFMRRARTPKYRNDEAQLTLMAHKLRLLKQRLADCKQDVTVISGNKRRPNPKISYYSEPSVKMSRFVGDMSLNSVRFSNCDGNEPLINHSSDNQSNCMNFSRGLTSELGELDVSLPQNDQTAVV